jgi:hypothetical protein
LTRTSNRSSRTRFATSRYQATDRTILNRACSTKGAADDRIAIIAVALILLAAAFMLGRATIAQPAQATPTNAQLNALVAIHRDLLGIQKQLGGSTSSSFGIRDTLVGVCRAVWQTSDRPSGEVQCR